MQTYLISQERAQKFDLLVHLITNLKQSLVLLGPKGIGKTTYLKCLLTRESESWLVLMLTATENLSFERILEWLSKELKSTINANRVENLAQLFQMLDKRNQSVVLLIDDAGHMIPGLITTLKQYATKVNGLKLVFTLTSEELALKNKTDATLEDSHVIAIPPLSSTQCGEYLHYLILKSDSIRVNNAINDEMADRIYKKTRGVPGKIVDEMPNLTAGRVFGLWTYLAVFVGIAAVAAGVFFWPNKEGAEQSQSNLVTANPVIAPLSIPGQTVPSPEELAAHQANQVQGKVAEINRNLPRPDIQNSKPDYYSGFTRVREADALEEFKADRDGKSVAQEPVEQLRVEILTPEPPPKEVLITASTSTVEPQNAMPKDANKPEMTVPTSISSEKVSVKPELHNAEAIVAKSAVEIPVKPSEIAVKPSVIENAVTKPDKPVIDLAKLAAVQKAKKVEIKKIPKPILNAPIGEKKPVDNRDQNDLGLDIAKTEGRVELSSEKLKSKPVLDNKIDVAEAKPELTVKKLEKVLPEVTKAPIKPAIAIKPASVLAEKQNDSARSELINEVKLPLKETAAAKEALIKLKDEELTKEAIKLRADIKALQESRKLATLAPPKAEVPPVKLDSEERKIEIPSLEGKKPALKTIQVTENATKASEKLDSVPLKETKESGASVVAETQKTEAEEHSKLGVITKYKSDGNKVVSDTEHKGFKKESVEKTIAQVDEKPVKQKTSSGSYTLQLMTFSQPESLQNFMRKYGSMGGNIRHITVNKDGSEKYVVVYGAFESAEKANAAKQKLPSEFRQAWARKM